MRSHRRRQPVQHVLIAGDLGDLAAMQSVLSSLDPSAYGQVFLETDGITAVPLLSTPARVTVHLLGAARAAVSPAHPVLSARGTALASAVDTWVGEWMPRDLSEAPQVSVWIGSRHSAAMTELYREMPVLAHRI